MNFKINNQSPMRILKILLDGWLLTSIFDRDSGLNYCGLIQKCINLGTVHRKFKTLVQSEKLIKLPAPGIIF